MKTLTITIFVLIVAIISSHAQQPSFEWAKKQSGACIGPTKVDKAGNVYTTGRINFYENNIWSPSKVRVDYDPGPDTCYLDNSSGHFNYITKYDASGNFVWAKTLPGFISTNNPYVSSKMSFVLDKHENIYITGPFRGTTDFDPGEKQFIVKPGSRTSEYFDIFVMKLDSKGNFTWAKRIGGLMNDIVNDIVLDGTNKIYISGKIMGGDDINAGSDSVKLKFADGDSFIMKFDSDGNYKWSKQWKANCNCFPSLAVDGLGNLYSSGSFSDTLHFNSETDSISLSSSKGNVYIVKLDSIGKLVWINQFGTDPSVKEGVYSSISIGAVSIKISNNIYIHGAFTGKSDFDPSIGEYNLTSLYRDTFTLKLDKNGNFIWVKQIPMKALPTTLSITLDAWENIYSVGVFSDTLDFDPSSAVYNLIAKGHGDMYISKIDSSGNFVWVKQIGGSSAPIIDTRGFHNDFFDFYDAGVSISVTESGDIYTVGSYLDSADVDPGIGEYQLVGSGYFLLKLSQTPNDVRESVETSSLSVYPNPATNSITLSFGKQITHGRVKLFNVLGQTVLSSEDIDGSSYTINMSDQPKGMYFIELSDNVSIQRAKFVKE